MPTKIKTMDDYKSATTKAKHKYLNAKINNNWNYAIKEEDHETFMFFMITNHHQATKIIFDKEDGVLVEKTMYTMDVRTMLELQKELQS